MCWDDESRHMLVIGAAFLLLFIFREPGGVLFEIATDTPGFTIDETEEELGTRVVRIEP